MKSAFLSIPPLVALLVTSVPGGVTAEKLKWESATRAEAVSLSKKLDERHEKGRAIYNFRCYFCQGYSGDANTLASTYLSPKPRDFTATDPFKMRRERMIESVKKGVGGTAMARFESVLKEEEIELVVDFIRREFMMEKSKNTWYHTPENGWPDHDRYSAAFPFAKGEIPLDAPDKDLTDEQRKGKRLFMKSCISCHDRASVSGEGPVWDRMPGLTKEERLGETLFQKNCAFCHARDGTGRNWFGAFLRPHPRNLTGDKMQGMTRQKLFNVIKNGVPGTSMSAWKYVLTDDEIEAVVSYVSKAFHDLGEG